MRKLNKNFKEQKKTVEVMTGLCANNTCLCMSVNCECNSSFGLNSNVFGDWNKSNDSAYKTNVKHM